MMQEVIKSTNHGRRNLIVLGLAAMSIAAITTITELWLYRTSGDIYLDRSRPGYLPDRDEVEENNNASSAYTYSETGSLDAAELQTYIDELKTVQQHIDRITDPYDPEPLSDESLGISAKADTNPTTNSEED